MITCPATTESGSVTLNAPRPVPSVVTVDEARKVLPSPNPVAPHVEPRKNSTRNWLSGVLFSAPATVTLPMILATARSG